MEYKLNMYIVKFKEVFDKKSKTDTYAITAVDLEHLDIRAATFGNDFTILDGPIKLNTDWKIHESVLAKS